jgi:hypothetical protein
MIVPGLITLRCYCEYGKEKAYNYLYDENGKHVLNDAGNAKVTTIFAKNIQ